MIQTENQQTAFLRRMKGNIRIDEGTLTIRANKKHERKGEETHSCVVCALYWSLYPLCLNAWLLTLSVAMNEILFSFLFYFTLTHLKVNS